MTIRVNPGGGASGNIANTRAGPVWSDPSQTVKQEWAS